MTLINASRVSSTIFLVSCVAVLLMASTSQGDILYWDTNGGSAGFGSGGTWGTDSLWTEDASGNFADNRVATTSADEVRINQSNLSSFAMGVSGSVQADRMVIPSDATPFATINGPGTIHVHTSGLGDANAVVSTGGDQKFVMNPNLVLEAAGGSTVTLGTSGGNQANATYNGSITSTNMVDLLFGRPGHLALNGIVDLQGGNFLSESGGTFRPKHHTMASGVLGSGVHDVERSGPLGGHPNDKGRLVLGANQAYTGDTFLDTSIIRLLADTSLPATTSVFITNGGLFELNFAGTNIISGLSIDGVALGDGVYGSSTHSFNFTGTGSLTVISAAPVPEPRAALMLVVGLLGLAAVRRRR